MERRVAIDYYTGETINPSDAIRFVVDIVDNILIFAYTIEQDRLFSAVSNDNESYWYNKERFQKDVIYDRHLCQNRIISNLNPRDYIYCIYDAQSKYIYSFTKEYGANTHLSLFNNKQKLISSTQNFKLASYLKYTFGLEFETAAGTLPEELCFRDGLIPLRDGSIAGNEYSTIVLKGNEGLNLLKQQVDTLRSFTYFDKECSLHIHLGGFELKPEVIYNVYKICYSIQDQLEAMLPPYTFKTSQYKNTHKDYCNKLPKNLSNFEAFYKYMVGFNYFGDLTQPHPADIDRQRKWNIVRRYYFVNFINALCYTGGKTIEFRFLRPTYNFNKIIFWLYIFNAILICAEENKCFTDIYEIIDNVYPKDLANDLKKNCIKTRICSEIQTKLGDYIGSRTRSCPTRA
jgi:hypothetical protein